MLKESYRGRILPEEEMNDDEDATGRQARHCPAQGVQSPNSKTSYESLSQLWSGVKAQSTELTRGPPS